MEQDVPDVRLGRTNTQCIFFNSAIYVYDEIVADAFIT